MLPIVAERMWDVHDIAAHLKVHPNTVRRWRREGVDMPRAVLIGGALRWDPDEVERWKREQLLREAPTGAE